MSGFLPDGGFDATTPLSVNRLSLPAAPVSAPGCRIGLNQLLLQALPFDEQLAVVQGLGLASLGLLRVSLWREGEERVGVRLREAGLSVTSLSWAGGFTGTAGFTFREAVADGRAALREAALVGADTLVVAPGGRGGHTRSHALRVAVDGLKFLSDAAAARRVRLAVKCDLFARRPRWTCVQSWETAAQVLDRVNSPWVGLACPIGPVTSTTASQLTALASRVHLAWTAWPNDVAAEAATHERWQARLRESLAILSRGGFRGVWEFRPHGLGDHETLAAAQWPAVQAAVAVVRQGLSGVATAESGGRRRAW